mmetsp:Transcript_31907/g.53806  ORF Transcript_31907/g.53806 Transcript_31907/m.53806 type:complete len:158 (-) Transcript_31907:718-1191(-)|eukprot:CAMPEP_0174954902 /NCGR_PEP_ID=MMETSP0004_2-20121128/685_1 /TAXON_ID=420556 /ORGANISM="Ochromonas sp., Strain CCMP1393" /LENGTH=157 /DNA_ID=CAMNT_0016202773 /DNA_START=88 /DNA_END=561 /DNA_ORIENTATION=-
MPSYLIKLKADLENIKQLIPLPENTWKFDIQSTDGGDTKEGITVTKGDVIPLDGSKGEANFVMKWPGASAQSYMKIVDVKNVEGNYPEHSSGEWVTILGLECRGLEPIRWVPEMDFIAESVGGHYFEEVDLSEGDWAEYDEEGDASVSIMNIETAIE